MITKMENLINKLKSKTKLLENTDRHSRDKLNHLVNELEHEMKTRHPDSLNKLVKPLNDSISHFETSHPEITETINEIMTTLSGIGI